MQLKLTRAAATLIPQAGPQHLTLLPSSQSRRAKPTLTTQTIVGPLMTWAIQ